MQLFIGGPSHVGLCTRKNFDEGEQPVRGGVGGQCGEVLPDFCGESFTTGFGVDFVDEEGAKSVDELLEELRKVFP